jgi:NAD(P)-dependent dehydrogenase (short-subunit alcohol dehydrogenase family)
MTQAIEDRLKGKTIIVTGAAGGLGREYAVRFAEEGANVTVVDVGDCAETARRVEAAGGEALAMQVDVSDEAQTIEMARATHERFGRIDGLMNNAGIMWGLMVPSLLDVDMETFDRVFAVNVRGVFLCMRAVFPYMRDQDSGTIVNVSSGSILRVARSTEQNDPHYVASKAAVMGLTRALARDLGQHNINVITLAPGATMSDQGEAPSRSEAKDQPAASLKRTGVPEDLTGVAAFMFSEDARFISGQMLVVNGGRELY